MHHLSNLPSCGVEPKIKVQYYVLFWYLGMIRRASNGLAASSPFTLLPQIRSWPTFLIMRTGHSSCLTLNSRLVSCKPTKLLKQANHVLQQKPESTLSSCYYYKACIQQPLAVHCFQVQPLCGPAGQLVSASVSWLWVYMTHKLLLVSFVQGWVSCMATLLSLGQEFLPHQWCEEEMIKTPVLVTPPRVHDSSFNNHF